ncbi:MAG TPA: D-aminoacyl-tRNA deacylase [Candidatus Eisenbacteria bacterium]|nr:D-aminoacyl-tRNA deacylase [Candidatus Eisenbacteria bacterium]
MRALVQRVSRASVRVDGDLTGEVGPGLLVLVGATHGDDEEAARWLARKVGELRIFSDGLGKMNLDVREAGGAVLVVPQFTLYGDARRGRRPDFMAAARPELAAPLVDAFVAALEALGLEVARGVFGAHMEVALVNDGPVTLMIESPRETAAP